MPHHASPLKIVAGFIRCRIKMLKKSSIKGEHSVHFCAKFEEL